jgi:hypothetical protein
MTAQRALFVFVGLSAIILITILGFPTIRIATLALELCLLWPPYIALHELGHAFVGWLVGFEFVAIASGPLQVEKSGHKLHLRWRGWSWGGHYHGVPTQPSGIAWRAIVIIAAGPIVNISIAVVLLLQLDNTHGDVVLY